MTDTEVFYRNVLIDDGEEIVVRASRGYSDVIEILIEGDITETIIRLPAADRAVYLGHAIIEAAQALLKPHTESGP